MKLFYPTIMECDDMFSGENARRKFLVWASDNIPESLSYTEATCLDYPQFNVYEGYIFNPDNNNCCVSGMNAPDSSGEYKGPVVPHIRMDTGEFVYSNIPCA